VEGKAPSLPEWDDLGRFFQDGIKLFGAGFIYMIPSTLLMGVGYLGMLIPLFLLEANMLSEYQASMYMIVGYLAGFGLMGVGAMIAMVTGLLLPVAGIHLVVKDDFSAAFKFRQIWHIFKANWSGFLVAFLIIIGASIFLYYGSYFIVATVILCCLYPFILSFMSAYLGVVGVALFGDAYRVSIQNLPAQK
jgi:hypothetical protein